MRGMRLSSMILTRLAVTDVGLASPLVATLARAWGGREIPQFTHELARIAPRSGERSYDLCGFAALDCWWDDQLDEMLSSRLRIRLQTAA